MRQGHLTGRQPLGSGWYFMTSKNKVTGDGFVRIENGILKCKSNAINQMAYTYFPMTIPAGTSVEIEFEAKRVSGSSDPNQAGGLGYNRWSETQNHDNMGGNLKDWIRIDSSKWKTYRFPIAGSQTEPFAAVMIGCFNNTIGEYWFRRAIVNFYNSALPLFDIRSARIVKPSGGSWKVEHAATEGQANIGVHKVEVFSNHIRVHYAPMAGWGSPVVHCTLDTAGGKYGWHANPSKGTRNYTDIYITDASNRIVAPSTLPSNTGIMFTAISSQLG